MSFYDFYRYLREISVTVTNFLANMGEPQVKHPLTCEKSSCQGRLESQSAARTFGYNPL